MALPLGNAIQLIVKIIGYVNDRLDFALRILRNPSHPVHQEGLV